MKRNTKNAATTLDRFLTRTIHPSSQEIDSSRHRVFERLKSDDSSLMAEPEEARRPKQRSFAVLIGVSAAAAAAIAIAVLLNFQGKVDARITVQAAEGTLHRLIDGELRPTRPGDSIQSGTLLWSDRRERATFALADGSQVEVRPQSEFSVEPASDGVRIRLNKGSLIVEAAKQRHGHLYVQTQDATISVVGTVFLVSAEEEGSRVAVIQGEVHVQHGSAAQALLPGQQVATGPRMPAIPVVQEISWSRKAESHLALLQRSNAEAIRPAGRLEFAATSIRPHSGVSPNAQETLGFVCHGVDGNRGADGEHVGAQGRVTAPQGRCVGNGVFVQALIAFAYGVPSRDVEGVPGWAVEPKGQAFARLPANAFRIDAVADNPSSATTAELIEMVKTMLAKRFQLKVHSESREGPGFALVVSKGGHKLKLKDPSDSEQPPSLQIDTTGAPIISGKSTMQKLAEWLGEGHWAISAPVVDRTGLTEVYDYAIDVLPRGGGGRGGQAQRAQTPEEINRFYIDLLEKRLGDQLGLDLIPEKTAPIRVIVVEKVEKPSEN